LDELDVERIAKEAEAEPLGEAFVAFADFLRRAFERGRCFG